MPILRKNEAAFRLLYDQQILVEGSSILDVLKQFDELPLVFEEEW